MLVLCRKQGEGIKIGDDIEMVVLSIRGSRVKLGFKGPKDIWIRRNEVTRPDNLGKEKAVPGE